MACGTGFLDGYRLRPAVQGPDVPEMVQLCTVVPLPEECFKVEMACRSSQKIPVPFSLAGNDEEAAPGRAAPRRHSPCFSND